MPLLLSSAPMPANDPISRAKRPQYGKDPDPLEGHVTTPWLEWLTRVSTTVSQGPSRLVTITLNGQAASIAATNVAGASLSAGLYRLTYYARITRATDTSSSLTVTFAWTDGVAQTGSGAAITGNSTTTWQSSSILVDIDSATPITYSTTYASVGTPTMIYKLRITMEKL